jgi:hypothetical protein
MEVSMNGFELKDVLTAVGPTASLIFAAWIFLSFLQQRYTSAYERYRSLISEYRQSDLRDQRKTSVRDQILLYKLRCERMRWATNIGVVSAIVLICTLIAGALYTVSHVEFLKYVSTACAIGGLLLVIWAAVVVLRENIEIQHAIDSELTDLPDLARPTGVRPPGEPIRQR